MELLVIGFVERQRFDTESIVRTRTTCSMIQYIYCALKLVDDAFLTIDSVVPFSLLDCLDTCTANYFTVRVLQNFQILYSYVFFFKRHEKHHIYQQYNYNLQMKNSNRRTHLSFRTVIAANA